MKILVIGLDCAAPELLLGDERLVHVRRLMEAGCFGRLESVVPPITVPAWMCMATSQDPGSLGVYGFRNRLDHSYDKLSTVDSRSFHALTIWDQIAREGGSSVLIGVPPSYPPKRVNGISIGCFITPDPARNVYTHPPDVAARIERLVGDYPVDVKNFRTDDKDRLRSDIFEMTRKHFEVVRHFAREERWDYFQCVEIGLDRIHHGFWKHHDPHHVQHDPDSPYRDVVRDYYLYLDHELGSVLELIDEDTLVLVVSDHGARPLDGGFCVNEWLHREGYLALERYPEKVTPFDELAVDWARTRAWSSGGYYARVFLNVKGREPRGVIEPADYEAVRSDLQRRLESTVDERGAPLGTRVFRPETTYAAVNGIAPDLIVYFADLAWRAVGGVGYDGVHTQENDTGPDDCNHAQYGAFVLAGPGVPAAGELEGWRLLDVAPTLLVLAGYEVPGSMQGRALLTPGAPRAKAQDTSTPDADAIVRERLKGLGYLG
jgi:predicted AlkP superfamily phosphohydrolase/phosphomutase